MLPGSSAGRADNRRVASSNPARVATYFATSGVERHEYAGLTAWDCHTTGVRPGFPFSKLITNLIRLGKAIDRRGFEYDQGGVEVERR